MKPLPAIRVLVAASCLLCILSAPAVALSPSPVCSTNTSALVEKNVQVSIRARFMEISRKDALKIGVSFPTDNTCLGFLAGIPSITNVFTITNTWQSLDCYKFLKINNNNSGVKYLSKNPDSKYISIIKLKKGICTLKLKTKGTGQDLVPKLMGIPLITTNGEQTKELHILINVLGQMSAEKTLSINYSVSPKGVMKIRFLRNSL